MIEWNRVYCKDTRKWLPTLPSECMKHVISDTMYGTCKDMRYDWGLDPAKGDPIKHWQYHREIYQQCRRILAPGGILCWAQGVQFAEHFQRWFGPHGLWPLMRHCNNCQTWLSTHIWVVQTRERLPIALPTDYRLIDCEPLPPYSTHPCPKPVEEMEFLIERLTEAGDTICDPCCGLGATLLAAQNLGRRFVGCDISPNYVRYARRRLKEIQ
jgi:DNA modification methylase